MIRQYVNETEREQLIAFFADRFGVRRDYFADKKFWAGSRRRVYMAESWLLEHPAESVAGLTVARISAAIKPSTDFLQLLGDQVTCSIVDVRADLAEQFVRGENLQLEDSTMTGLTDGYVCVRYCGFNLGCGFYRDGVVENLISQDRRRALEHL